MYKRQKLRIVLLVIGALLSAAIFAMGIQMMDGAIEIPSRIRVQSVALIVIGITCFAGVMISAWGRDWLREHKWLGNGLICVAFSLPVIDFYALLPDPGAHRALTAQALLSALIALMIALAIATAWVRPFNRTSLD